MAWATSSTNHLQEVSEWEINVTPLGWVKEFSSLDDNKPCWEINTPRKSARSHKNLNLFLYEEVLNNLAVRLFETSMMHAHTELYCVSKILVFDELTDQADLFGVNFEERLFEVEVDTVGLCELLLLVCS